MVLSAAEAIFTSNATGYGSITCKMNIYEDITAVASNDASTVGSALVLGVNE